MNKHLSQIDFQSVLMVGSPDVQAIRSEAKVSEADCMVLSDETIKIVQIRELLHWLNLKPMNSSKKLAIIINAENMEIESANTLLKTLEEPPSYAQIILTTLSENRILATIQSRCRKIRLNEEIIQEKPENYLTPGELNKLSVKDKLDWVGSVSDLTSSQIGTIITLWQIYYREKMLKGEVDTKILKSLSRAKDLLATNISVKLLLENLVLNF